MPRAEEQEEKIKYMDFFFGGGEGGGANVEKFDANTVLYPFADDSKKSCVAAVHPLLQSALPRPLPYGLLISFFGVVG